MWVTLGFSRSSRLRVFAWVSLRIVAGCVFVINFPVSDGYSAIQDALDYEQALSPPLPQMDAC